MLLTGHRCQLMLGDTWVYVGVVQRVRRQVRAAFAVAAELPVVVAAELGAYVAICMASGAGACRRLDGGVRVCVACACVNVCVRLR
jgi:hypothetical protein